MSIDKAKLNFDTTLIWCTGPSVCVHVQAKNNFPAHWDPKLRIPRGQVVAAASIVSPKY